MTAHSEDRAQALFDAALELPEEHRDGFLDRECGTNEGLRRQLERLLQLHTRAERELRDPAEPPHESPGDRIGHCELLQRIGEGGFGTVWMAAQERPVRRRVALKVLKAGMDTAQVVGRFEAERQALAMMDHPNIAKVFDGGATPQGRPYFVMELVEGIPITRYCDDAGLGMRKRLELFVPVCQAVQHAHQKGVIHRDLKPGNVLVTLHDGKPVPKVIDFGIAKATQGRLTDRTVVTGFQQMLGTPEYMAPEQAELSGLDVDTRADIYSLGVLLYELLTGTRPFELKTLLEAGYAEMVRTIKEVDPPKPSTRVSTLGDELLDVARHRQVHPRALGTLMRGDLDWIVMKALEKERSRRYDTATALADDVLRHLAHEPVLAGPPSRLYRWRKYVRRHRVGVAAGAAIALALLAGGVAATLGYMEAREQTRQAQLAGQKADDEKAAAILARAEEQRQKEAAQRSEAAAEQARAAEQEQRRRAEEREATALREARKSRHLVDLLQEMLAGSNPEGTKSNDYTVRELLDDFDRGLGDQLAMEPEVELALRLTLANSYVKLGLPDRATPHLERARTLADGMGALDPRERTNLDAAEAGYLLAKGDYARAMDAFAALVEGDRGEVPDEEVDNWRRQLAISACRRGDPEQAVRIVESLVVDIEAREGDQRLTLSLAWQFLSVALMERNDPGDLERAEQVARRCLELQRELLPADDYPITYSMNNLATVLGHLGRWQDARPLLEDVLHRDLERYGDDHRRVAEDKVQLAHVLCQLARPDLAEPLVSEAVAHCRSTPGNLLDLANALNQYASALYLLRRYQEALDAWTEALAIRRKELGPHDSTARILQNVAVAHTSLGRVLEARTFLEESLSMRLELHGEGHLEVATARLGLGDLLSRLGELEAAEAQLRAALTGYQRNLRATHPFLAEAESSLARCLYRMGRFEEAIAHTEAALAIGRTHWPPNSRSLMEVLKLLGGAHWQRGNLPAAQAVWTELARNNAEHLGTTHPATLTAKLMLAQVILDQVILDQSEARAADAEQLAGELIEATRQDPATPGPTIAPLLVLRAEARLLAGHADAAEQDLQEALRLCREATTQDAALARSQLACGEYLLARGRAAEAEPLLRSSVDLAAPEGTMSIYRWIAASALGGALLQQGRHAEGEPLLVEAIAKLPIPMAMPDARARRQTLERLVQLYETSGRPEQAEPWRAKLAEMPTANR
ncbi:MAG: tetratricopeptide repeat protein [Planctomycetes bacterium]|nr:tetratricopeptide repeat protein [Planctomycetota bacterium]